VCVCVDVYCTYMCVRVCACVCVSERVDIYMCIYEYLYTTCDYSGKCDYRVAKTHRMPYIAGRFPQKSH